MPINAHPDYLAAEKEHLLAQTSEEKIKTLEKMISLAPKHKGAENLRAQLKTKLKKLKERAEKSKKAGKSFKKGIKKEDMQATIIGVTNSGKSSLLKILTNAQPEIESYSFTTKIPIIGMLNFSGVQIQLIENPSISSEFYDKGLTNSADTILMVITNLSQIKEIEKSIETCRGKKIIVFNKIDKLNNQEKRKIQSTLQSKRYVFSLISCKTREGIEELKKKLFQSFDKIRVFTKEPGKEKSNKPIVLDIDSTVENVAEKILHGFSKQVRDTRVTGPSSKFPNQKVSLNHKLKDLDVVEFKIK